MPTSAINTYQDDMLQPSRPCRVRFDRYQVKVSVTIAKGTVVGRVTATGKVAAYANANSDGTEVAIGIMPYSITTDASGNITVQGGNVLGTTQDTVPIIIAGYFLVADITGLDAGALTDLGAHAVWGNGTSTGEIVIAGA
jgi:hypothetical protein